MFKHYTLIILTTLILSSLVSFAQENRSFEQQINKSLRGRFQFYEFTGTDTIRITNAKIYAKDVFNLPDSVAGEDGLITTNHTVAIDENDLVSSVLLSQTSALEMLFISREKNKGYLQAFEFWKGKRHIVNNFPIEWKIEYTEGNPIMHFSTTEEYYDFIQTLSMTITEINDDYIELQHNELCATFRYQKIK